MTVAGSMGCLQQFSADKQTVAVVGSTGCFDDASAAIMFFLSGGVPVDSRAPGILAGGAPSR